MITSKEKVDAQELFDKTAAIFSEEIERFDLITVEQISAIGSVLIQHTVILMSALAGGFGPSLAWELWGAMKQAIEESMPTKEDDKQGVA